MTSDMVAQVQRRGQILDAPRGVIRTLVVVICDCIRTRMGFHCRCPAWGEAWQRNNKASLDRRIRD